MEELLAIGRFARLTQLTIRALRLYDARGLLEPAVVDFRTGFRYYRPEQVPVALRIRALRALDLPLQEVGAVIRAQQASEVRLVLARHRRRVEEQIATCRQVLRALRTIDDGCISTGKDRSMADKGQEYRCSFCGKPNLEVKRMIAGPDGVFICNECVRLCNELIAKKEQEAPATGASA